MGTRQSSTQTVRASVALMLVGLLVTGACSSGVSRTAPHPADNTTTADNTTAAKPTDNTTTATTRTTATTTTTATGAGAVGNGEAFTGLMLSAGHAATSTAQPTTIVAGDPLDEAAVGQVESRLPQWATDASLAKPFNWPTASKPVPVAGKTVDRAFPAVDQTPPPTVVAGPLHVLRHQPDGPVAIAPFVTITFDQPMAPITTVGQLAAGDAPATITPAIPGRWQWIGTSTLRFDATSTQFDRLPMATVYTVAVAAGTKSATGGVLADAVSFQFSTPPVTVRSFQPTGTSLPLVPVFAAVFDQRVDQQAVLATTTLKTDEQRHQVRLATAAEIQADDVARRMLADAPEGRWVAFRPIDPLPADSKVTVQIGPGTPSAEGSATATSAATYDGRTFAPLAITDVRCSYGPSCPPPTDIAIAFNNELEVAAFDPGSVRTDPPIPGVSIGADGNTITIHGATEGHTTYKITIAAGLKDVHGQALAADQTRSVDIGIAAPRLQQFAQPLTTLDPLAPHPSLSVVTVNHHDFHLRVFKVAPAGWGAYMAYLTATMQGPQITPPLPKWPLLLDTTVAVAAGDDRAIETAVDVSPQLGGARGHVVVVVEPTEHYDSNSSDYWSNRPAITWVQATSIGLDAFNDTTQLRAWASDLGTGAPLAGVSITPHASAANGVTTDADGLATIALDGNSVDALVATKGDDSAILPNGFYGGGWQAVPSQDQARWYVFDDRQTYRPGETVNIKGWVRRLTANPELQLQLFSGSTSVSFSAHDGQGNVIASGQASVDPIGGFNLGFAVPADANLGASSVELQLGGADGLSDPMFQHGIQIQEFRRPDFEVATHTDSAAPFVQGTALTVAADATYYAGGPLGSAPVAWQVTTAAARYSPPNRDSYTFGIWTPWWYADDAYRGDAAASIPSRGGPCCDQPPGRPSDQTKISSFSGTTDAGGSNYLQVDVGKLDDKLSGLPVTVTAEATVTDVNRQAIAGNTTVLVHPASFYVGLRSDRTFVKRGEPLTIDAVVTDIDGTAVPGRTIQVTASRTESVFQHGHWVDTDVDVQHCDVVSTATGVTCSFTPSAGGTYTIKANVADYQGRSSRTQLTRWVTGADSVPARNVARQDLTVVPDKAEYQPGDAAQIFVQSPFADGTGMLTLTRGGIVSTTRFDVADGSAIVPVPITEQEIPNVDVSIEVVGSTERTADDGTALPNTPPRPAFATGSLRLAISTKSRALTVTATPKSSTVAPGSTTQVDVTVVDANGAPVNGSQFAVVVVDEAVLALSDYRLGDPLATFYGQLPSYLSSQYGRQSIVLTDPLAVASQATGEQTAGTTAGTAAASATTTASGGAESGDSKSAMPAAAATSAQTNRAPVAVRTNFGALAVFDPSVVTDASGKATIDVPLPDSLTRYRVMVVAVAGADRFGSTESNITARLALIVRPSAPRFLNFGDTAQLPVVVQNQTDTAMPVDLVLQTDNLTVTGSAGQHVVVPANARIEVRFAVSAAQAGTAKFRVAAVSGEASDAATVELPVYTPATSETFATYGVVDDGATVQPVTAPTGVFSQFGGLDITTSSTSLQALTDAVLYLVRYPYESADAMASRILAITSLKEVLKAFDAPGMPTPNEMTATINDDVASLAALQNDDGGFAYWQRGDRSDPFDSIEVVHALTVAKAAGFAVPQGVLGRGLGFLGEIEQHIPSEYGQAQRDSISAYALNVRMLAGSRDSAKAKRLFDQRGKSLPLDAIAWLWPVIDSTSTSAAIETIIQNLAVDTAGAITFTTNADDGAYLTLQSDRRTDGLLLDALIRVRPKSDLIPKVVAGLLAAQTQGRWDNVQENSFILLAMKRYFDTYEAALPNFVADVWLGDRLAGEQPFTGRSTDQVRLSIPTADLMQGGDAAITIAKQGAGRLYYRIGLQTAPTDLHLLALDRGFVVARSYEAVDDPGDVRRDADGTWHVKAGARVRVRLTMVAENQRTHVALIDPLPAGLEILNPSLATTPSVPAADHTQNGNGSQPGDGQPSTVPSDFEPWHLTWFDHQNMRDDRAEAFSNVLPAGAYDYSYVAVATTPGTYVVPPTRAEEMYAPETFGRAATDSVVVG